MGIDAPERGGGFEAMTILHGYGVYGKHKNILRGKSLDRALFKKAKHLESYLKMDI